MHGDQFGELECRYWDSHSLPFSCGEMICYPNEWISEQSLIVLYHSNKTSLADLSHCIIYFSGFYKKKFEFLCDFVLFGHYKEWKETKRPEITFNLTAVQNMIHFIYSNSLQTSSTRSQNRFRLVPVHLCKDRTGFMEHRQENVQNITHNWCFAS